MNPELAYKQSLRHARCPASRRMWRFAAAVCVAALTVSFVGCTKGDLRPSQQVLLEAAASAGQSPWMESVSSANVPTEVSRVEQAPSTAAAETQDDTVKVSGDQVGLYGGTPGVAACDREKMVKFLETHSPQATAWKNVTGAKDIRSYAQTLSPVVLTHDTRVTNHGFKNGQASPFQSVLETGTPVLIDDRGVPRVRCACGNPLAEPQSATKQEFSGSAWRTFKKTSLVTVQQSVKTLDKVELVSVPVTDAPPPVTPFAAISPGETTPKPAPETVLPPGAILVPAGGSSSPATPSVNSGSDTNTTPPPPPRRRRQRQRQARQRRARQQRRRQHRRHRRAPPRRWVKNPRRGPEAKTTGSRAQSPGSRADSHPRAPHSCHSVSRSCHHSSINPVSDERLQRSSHSPIDKH